MPGVTFFLLSYCPLEKACFNDVYHQKKVSILLAINLEKKDFFIGLKEEFFEPLDYESFHQIMNRRQRELSSLLHWI